VDQLDQKAFPVVPVWMVMMAWMVFLVFLDTIMLQNMLQHLLASTAPLEYKVLPDPMADLDSVVYLDVMGETE
jgi:hypothetical protein